MFQKPPFQFIGPPYNSRPRPTILLLPAGFSPSSKNCSGERTSSNRVGPMLQKPSLYLGGGGPVEFNSWFGSTTEGRPPGIDSYRVFFMEEPITPPFVLGAPSAVVLPTNPPNVSMSRQFRECYSDLSGLIPCPVLGSIILLFIPNSRIRLIRFIGPCVSLLTFLYSLVLRMQSDSSTAEFQFVGTIRWLPHENINLYMGPDGISSFFVVLTTFLIPICILVGWSSIESYGKEYVIVFPICEFLMIAVSRMPDLLLLHVLLESVLIPMLCGAEHLLFAGSL